MLTCSSEELSGRITFSWVFLSISSLSAEMASLSFLQCSRLFLERAGSAELRVPSTVLSSVYHKKIPWAPLALCPCNGFPQWLSSEIICLQCRSCRRLRFEPWVRKIPWRRAWHPTPAFLPGESPWTEEPGGLQSAGSQRVRRGFCILLCANVPKAPRLEATCDFPVVQ